MEHRCGERMDVDLKTTIFKQGIMVGKGRIKNGSAYGLYLETAYSDANILQKLALEVVLQPTPQETVSHKIHAIVTRKSASGLGLELETIGEQDSAIMSKLIDAVRSMGLQASFKPMI